jgi:hypothetical protein
MPLPIILIYLSVSVAGVAVNLYTDTACKNQVGHLDGSYGGVCQMTLGTAATSFMVVNVGSGCLSTMSCSMRPKC